MDKNDRKLGRRMLTVYQETDRKVQARAEASSTTCRKGCGDCCKRFLISVTFPEAVAVAEYVLTEPKFSLQKARIFKQLHAQVAAFAEAQAKKDVSHYRQAQVACPFLSSENTCEVYKVRPSSCRLHYAVSDPVHCGPNATEATQVVDMSDISVDHLNDALHVSRQTGTPLWSGPYAIMLLWAFKLLQEGRKAIEAAHQTDQGIMSLHIWRLKPPSKEAAEATPLPPLDPEIPHE